MRLKAKRKVGGSYADFTDNSGSCYNRKLDFSFQVFVIWCADHGLPWPPRTVNFDWSSAIAVRVVFVRCHALPITSICGLA